MEDLSDTIIVAIISSATTILVLILTGVSRYFFFLFSLTYKLKREYNFSQKKNIKLVSDLGDHSFSKKVENEWLFSF